MNEVTGKSPMLESFLDNIGGFESLIYSFVISLVLLFIISLLKYFIINKSQKKEWMFMLLELPIDVCVILITIIVTGFIRGGGATISESVQRYSISSNLIGNFNFLLFST